MPRHKLNNVYSNMKARCYNKNYDFYYRYGGRGIRVCDRWLGKYGFQNFLSDMGDRPEGYQLDRIDNDGNYSPENCRWVDKYTQMGNTSNTKVYPGVSFMKSKNKWRARIKINNKEKHIGLYKAVEDAINARMEYNKSICLF